MVSLDLNIGSSLTEVGVDIATLGERALRGRRSRSLGVVRLSGSVCLELRRELRRQRNSGSLGGGRGLELADLALVRVGSLRSRRANDIYIYERGGGLRKESQ